MALGSGETDLPRRSYMRTDAVPQSRTLARLHNEVESEFIRYHNAHGVG